LRTLSITCAARDCPSMKQPEIMALSALLATPMLHAAVVCTPSVVPWVRKHFSCPIFSTLDDVPTNSETLMVVGGGLLLDQAKHWRHTHRPNMHLVAIPSLWGSGAEVSPIVVLHENGKKIIHVADAFLPDTVIYDAELAAQLPNDLARYGCGDAWSHALEGFLSPLANDDQRASMAPLLKRLTSTPMGHDPAWFSLSADACRAQAASSVGLIHGMAHVLEGPLREKYPEEHFGHAKLCSLFLSPVMAFNLSISDKFLTLAQKFQLDSNTIMDTLQKLFDPKIYALVLPTLEAHWRDILRDPCTRTNHVLVRPNHLAFFLDAEKP
jgi:alcohol dehydrogenase class IV